MPKQQSKIVHGTTRATSGLVALVLLAAAAGCRHWDYTPATLPTELAAAPSPKIDQLDLTALAGRPKDNQTIFPGDVLQVTAYTGIDPRPTPWNVRVEADGSGQVPLIGQVRLAGYDADQAETAVRQASMQRQIFKDPAVAIDIKQRRTNRVTVAGAVAKPGVYELPAYNSTLGAALLAAGGLTDTADGVAEIRSTDAGGQGIAPVSWRGGPAADSAAATQVRRIDLVSAAQGVQVVRAGPLPPQPDYSLQDGAYVLINSQPQRQIHVIGSTRNVSLDVEPGRDLRLLDAIAQAGGPTYSTWVSDRVHVIRRIPGTNESRTIRASIRRAKRNGQDNVLLAEGDVVSVEENLATFTLGTAQRALSAGYQAALIGSLP